MGSVDRGIHRDHPVHLALGIGLGSQFGKDPVPGAVIGELLVPLPHRLPRPEHLPGKIPPRDPGAVAVGDRLHHGAVITVGTPHLALVARQQRLDSLPLLISENPVTTHPATLPRPSAHGWETRPSGRGSALYPVWAGDLPVQWLRGSGPGPLASRASTKSRSESRLR